MKRTMLATVLTVLTSQCFALGSLENPVADKTESGIGVISGWHCTANNITVTIDGTNLGKAGSGTLRNDTAGVCGRTDTGFALLYNYNDLTPGNHVLSLYVDGQLFEVRQFKTVQSGGASFARGLVSGWTLTGFPSAGRVATIDWSQAKQSFVVTGITGSAPLPPPPSTTSLSALDGSYSQFIKHSFTGPQNTFSGSSCYGYPDQNMSATISIATNGLRASVTGTTSAGTCIYSLSYAGGNSSSGFNLIGSSVCNSILATNVTASNIRKVGNELLGTITTTMPNCTQTTTL